MTKSKIKSVCILVDCLTGGGAEKAASLVSKSFHEANFHVSIIAMQGEIDYDFKGDLYDLSGIFHKIPFFKSLKKMFVLKKTWNKINADFYLDFRIKSNSFRELMFHFFIYDIKKTVLTIHSSRIHNYMPRHILFYKLYNRAKSVVVVSEGIYDATKRLFDFDNLEYIPNFYDSDIFLKSEESIQPLNGKYIIAVGRLKNEVKQFDKLILAYKDSLPAKKGIPLFILGRGKDKEVLEEIVLKNNLSNIVKLLGFKNNPYPYIKSSQFLLLSSKLEGFGIVLIEALALGVPVISFDCKVGPSEIIQDKKNGILVKDQDFIALKTAIDNMYSDKELYAICKENGKSSVEKYSDKEVLKTWVKLLNSFSNK